MSTRVENGRDDAHRAEAAEWFVTLQGNDVSRADQEAFADWLRRSPVHIEEFLQLTALQGDLARLPEVRKVNIVDLLAEATRQPLPSNVLDFRSCSQLPESAPRQSATANDTKRAARYWSAAGAAILLAATATVFVNLHSRGEQYTTAVGEQRSVTLSDGSHIQLNVQSSLTAQVTAAARDIRLTDGEALFQVAKDVTRPFRVHTPQATVEATGTQFDVHVKDGATVVALLEGHVQVRSSPTAPPMLLEPGQQITIASRATGPALARTADLDTVTAWTERRLVFDDAPLYQVVAEFNRYSRQQLFIREPGLRNKRITASFNAGDARTFGTSLAAAGGLRVTQQPDGNWLIGPAGPGARGD